VKVPAGEGNMPVRYKRWQWSEQEVDKTPPTLSTTVTATTTSSRMPLYCQTQRPGHGLAADEQLTECILMEMMSDCRSLSSGFNSMSLVRVRLHSLHTHTHTHTHTQSWQSATLYHNTRTLPPDVQTTTTTILRPFFPGPPSWAGARRKLPDFMVQAKINRGRHTDHPTGRHSVRTNQCPHLLHRIFYRPDALPAAQPTVSKHWKQLAHSEYGEDTRVLLNGVTCTVSVPLPDVWN